MKKIYTLFFILMTTLSFGQTPIGLIQGFPHSESFDAMGTSSTAFLPGWTAINTIGNVSLTMAAATDGTLATGNAYNVGTNASTDRSFGTLADGTIIPAIGAVFQNNSGAIVSRIGIRTKMEQWRASGNSGVPEKVVFYYSLDASSLSTGTWTPVTALDLNEKLTTASSAVAVDGNLPAHYTYPIQTNINLNWANGANLWIKWVDTNDALDNGMYAIDDFEISIVSTLLGVKQNQISGLNMYPNPVSNGTLYITSNSSEAKSITIYDVLGKQVLSDKTSNNAVNVSTLKRGPYIVKISEDGKTDTKKLIIE